jgi:hypothetical protein
VRYQDIYQGAAVRVRVRFTDPATGGASPVTEPVSVTFKDPSGVVSAAVAGTLESVGVYVAIKVASIPGRWSVRAVSSGAQPAVAEDEFMVKASRIV